MGKRGEEEAVTDLNDQNKRRRSDSHSSVSPKKLVTWTENRQKGSIRFEASGLPTSNFCSFIENNAKTDVVRFFRDIVGELEEERGVKDFHFKIRDQKSWFCIEVFFGEEKEGPAPVADGECISCFAGAPLYPGKDPGITAGECILAEFSDQPHVQCSLDAKARSGFVVTPVRHVERMSELQDEELFALWSTAVRALRGDSVPFRTMILNHGTYRNTPHLHLKVWVDDKLHQQVRSNWNSEKVELWNRLLAMVGTVPKRPCKFFQERGRCWQDDGCRFLHVKSDAHV